MLKWLFCGLFVVCASRFPIGVVDGALIDLHGPRCGTLVCRADEYCNQYSHGCESCKLICDQSNHNFDETKCKEQCEVYIYDQRYFKRSADSGEDNNLRISIEKLEIKYTAVLSLLVIVIVILIVLSAIFTWSWKKSNNITWATVHHKISGKKSDNNANGVTTTKMADNDHKKPDLRLDISANSIQSEPTPVTVTTGITARIPAEDSIDYAYDNPAMSNSPKKSVSTTG